MTQFLRLIGASLVVAVACLGLAACGSSSNGGTSASTGASSTGGSSTQTSGEKAAAAYLTKFTPNPTSVALPALPSKPPTGKSLIYLTTPEPLSVRASAAHAAAAKVLGWNYTTISAGATPSSAAAAFEAAIARHPNAIEFSGYPGAIFAKQIQAANAAGITVFSDATGDPENTPGVLADMAGSIQEAQYGKILAAYFVVHAGSQATAAVVSIPAFPIFGAFVTAFTSAVKQWCPTCSVSTQNQQITDIGTKTPSNLVSYLQRNPSVKWLVFGNGDLATGVVPALKTAGMSGVHIIGEVPAQADFVNIANGTEEMWVGYPVDVNSWRELDLLARHFEHASIAPDLSPNLPAQPITKSNINSAVISGDYYVGVKGYQSQYAKLWHVG
jgi:ribose transport system substrate-binding protein